jgi:hypothetical protein
MCICIHMLNMYVAARYQGRHDMVSEGSLSMCVYVCMHVCIYIYMYIYIYIYVYIYI